MKTIGSLANEIIRTGYIEVTSWEGGFECILYFGRGVKLVHDEYGEQYIRGGKIQALDNDVARDLIGRRVNKDGIYPVEFSIRAR